MKTKEKVQAAILDRLESHSCLDLKSMDVATTNLSFEKNLAYATVAFHPKGDPSVNGGMTMKYTLEARDGKWVVIKVGDSSGHPAAGSLQDGGSSNLPPGHPTVDPSINEQGASPEIPQTPAPTQ